MIDINQFCGKDDIRSHLNAPFIVDGRIVATNGHVIIVMPNDGKNEYLDKRFCNQPCANTR